MRRLALRLGASALAGTALAGLLLGPGCASAPRPDALRVSLDLSNAAGAALRAAQAEHKAALEADIARRAATCALLEPAAQPACLQAAAQDALSAAAPEATRLTELAVLQRAAARALKAASQCRADGLPCEAEHVRDAASPLAQARAGLGLGQGADAGAEGGAGKGGAR